jgi:mRNA-degrading endonuclease RelE of RelBE toxin-antitoxin system
MSFNVVATDPFERKLKKLAKKHKSIVNDILPVIDSLMVNLIN